AEEVVETRPEVSEDMPAFADVATGEAPPEPLEEPADAVESHVEVGEAPEEVEAEPAPEEEKRRRRRRRRRGRKSSAEGGAEAPTAEAVNGPAPEAGGLAENGDAGLPEVAEGDDDLEDGDEDDDDEAEPISFADINVPTWQELIASLYR